jgi:O-methyltransferase
MAYTFPERLIHKFIWFAKNFRQIKKDSAIFHAIHGPAIYNADGLATSNNSDFLKDERFIKAYNAAAATRPWEGFTSQWRFYIVCWFADYVKQLEGDFVECGVNTGAYSKAIIEYINFDSLGKTFYLLDTFEGLVKEQITEEEVAAGVSNYLNAYTDVYEQVKQTFKDHKVQIIKGAVPGTLPLVSANKIAYLSIDMNVTKPEIEAMEYFWDKMVSGGVLIHDDYGFPQHIHQKRAVDTFARERNVPVLSLPTGQAIIFKP